MSILDNLKQKILNRSDMYNHYKAENAQLKKDLKKVKRLNKEVKKLNKKQRLFEDRLESDYFLLNFLMLNYSFEPRGILKNMYELCQELLNFVVITCDKNDLDYWLVGGNLIGAVRHEGFVPWDDDVDVGMIRKEFYKFNKVVKEEIKDSGLDQYITLTVYPRPRKNFLHAFTKIDCITPNNDVLAGVDVFPYDYAKDDNFTFEEFFNYRETYFTKLVNRDEESLIEDYYNKFNLDWDDGKYIIPNPSVFRYSEEHMKPLIFWEKDKIMPFTLLNYNGTKYNCPNDPDYFLRLEFGDYYNIPKVIQDQHYNVDKLRNVDNIDELYEEYLFNIRQYNEKFL